MGFHAVAAQVGLNNTPHATCSCLVFRQPGGKRSGPFEGDRDPGELAVAKDHVPTLRMRLDDEPHPDHSGVLPTGTRRAGAMLRVRPSDAIRPPANCGPLPWT